MLILMNMKALPFLNVKLFNENYINNGMKNLN